MTSTEAQKTALKMTREKLGLSINDVSVATKISPRILKALEEGDYTELPPQSFTRGFIRSYSAYLKIDAQPVLDAYTAAIQTRTGPSLTSIDAPNDATQTKAADEQDPSSQHYSSTTNINAKTKPLGKIQLSEYSQIKRFVIFGGLVFTVFVIIGIKKIVDRYANERIVAPESEIQNAIGSEEPISSTGDTPSENVTAEESAVTDTSATDATDTSAPNLNVADEKAADTAATPTQVNTPAAQPTNTPVPVAADKTAVNPPTPTATPVAAPAPVVSKPTATPAAAPITVENKPVAVSAEKPVTTAKPALATNDKSVVATKPPSAGNTTTTATATVKAASDKSAATPSNTTKPEEKKSTPQEVIIEALDGVEITVQIDNESPRKIKLAPDSVHTIKAKGKVALDIKDGGMVNLIHNGRERGVPGDLGKPAQVKFP